MDDVYFSLMEMSDNQTSCRSNCSHVRMPSMEKGQFNVVAILRLIMACLSILGTFSIIFSAVYRKTVCNPKVHPIFVLSIADMMLGFLWLGGSSVWLKGGAHHHHDLRVGCFTINLMTVILECVTMNLTLIYALLAYSGIKQRDFSGVYMVQERPASLHVWPPLLTFIAYFIAWILPVFLIMIPFGVFAVKFELVQNTNNCSCWCLPYFGNVIPRPELGHTTEAKDRYLVHLYGFIDTYAMVILVNYLIVFACMAVIYYKVFRRIRRMRRTQERTETTPLYGATQAMILTGQKDAKKRVLLFLTVFLVTGIFTCMLAVYTIVVGMKLVGKDHQLHKDRHINKILYTLLLLEATFVPVQGFLNAVVYGWTRGDFLNVMSSQRPGIRQDSFALSQDTMDEEEETQGEDDEEDEEEEERERIDRTGNSILFLSVSQEMEGGGTADTPGTPRPFLGRAGSKD